jgi:hypothetical protein
MSLRYTHVYINLPVSTVLGQAPDAAVERVDEEGCAYHLFDDPELGRFALACDTAAPGHQSWTELLHEAGPEAEPVAKTLVRLGISPAQIESSTGPAGERLAPIERIRSLMRSFPSRARSTRARPSTKQSVA